MRISDWSSDVCSSDLAALLDASTHRLAEDVAEIEHAHGGAGHAGNLHGRQLHAAGVLHLDLDFLIVDLALAQAGAELLARVGARRGANQRVEHALFRVQLGLGFRSEEHTSELQSLMRNSSAVFCLKKKTNTENTHH